MVEATESYVSYSAPQQHGQTLMAPGWDWAREQLNSRSFDFGGVTIGGQALSSFRSAARRSVIQLAKDYTSSYRELPKVPTDETRHAIVMGGHQPELFHCGVWFKNFLISQLAEATGAIPIHFIVDNDLCRSTGITVPTINQGIVGSQFVPFDSPADPIPWENRRLMDSDLWSSFPRRVGAIVPKVQGEPLLRHFWMHLRDLPSDHRIGRALSQARHLVERDAGLSTLEVPLSHIVATAEFAAFVLYLIAELPKLRDVYNAELDNYRRVNKIRNHAQPLPNLAAIDDWLEAPLWCYSPETERRALWVRILDNQVILSDRHGWQHTIQGDFDSSSSIEQWMAIHESGVQLRPRALITTMYARLAMCDLFVHGIGGGRYDQITDRIIQRFFGIQVPSMLVASATMRLAFAEHPRSLLEPIEPQIQHAEKALKSLEMNPDQLTALDAGFELDQDVRKSIESLATQKRLLLASMPAKGEKWEWHVAMKNIKQQLSEAAEPLIGVQRARVEQLRELSMQQKILQSREYSFCLFSLEEVQRRFTKLL